MAGSMLVAEERFVAGDPTALDALFTVEDAGRLGGFAKRWFQDPRPFARRLLLSYIDDGCDRPHHRSLVKRLFKAAEEAGDDEAMAHFLVAFDRLRRKERVELKLWERDEDGKRKKVTAWRVPRRANEVTYDPKTHQRTVTPTDGRFMAPTRQYLQRRALRYFRRKGYKDPAGYRRAITRALVLYSDTEIDRPEHLLDARSLVHVLFWGAPTLVRTPRHLRFEHGTGIEDLGYAPLHPAAWRDCADALRDLALAARCRPVRLFALDRLRVEHAAALASPTLAWVKPLFASPHEEVQAFAASLLGTVSGWGTLAVDEWLALLGLDSPVVVTALVPLFQAHVARERLSLAQLVALACARVAPVAELALAWLKARPPRDRAELASVLAARDAEAPPVRAVVGNWLAELVAGHAAATALDARELVDARYAEVRTAALALVRTAPARTRRVAPTAAAPGRFADAPELWAAMAESPYDDVREHLVAELERARATFAPETLEHIWATALLAVRRGGRARVEAARQVARRLEREPVRADRLLPLLAIALRGLRAPDRRAALASVVRAVTARPSLEPQVARHLPELALLPSTAWARQVPARPAVGSPKGAR